MSMYRHMVGLVASYDEPDFHEEADRDAADGVTVGMVWMKEARDLLDRVSERVCHTCEGVGFVDNPHAHYTEDMVEGHHTGVYSTNDPEEIDCPDCDGVGFTRRKRHVPGYETAKPGLEDDIAF